MKSNPTNAPRAVHAQTAIGTPYEGGGRRWHFPSVLGILFLLCAMSAGAARPAFAAAAEAGLRLNRIESKAKGSGDLAQKAGGPTERIEIQSTDDHIDYVVKSYALKQANASEVYELIKAAIALEGGKVDRVSPGSVVDINMEGLESKHTYSGDSLLVVTVPEWMIPYLDRTIEMLDRPNLESSAFGTGVAYMPVRHRLPSEVAELIAQSAASPSIILRPDDTRQLLYVEDTPSFFQYDLAALKAFDVPPPQIETRIRIYEIDESRGKDVGVDWNAWKKSIKDGDLTLAWESLGGSYDLDLKSLSAELSFTPMLATEFLNYLVGRDHAKVVTDTRLTQINSKPAIVQSLTQIPYVVRGFLDGDVADSPVRDSPEALDADRLIKEFREGVVVEMTPRIGDEIEIAVSAVVASLVGYTPNQSVPLVTESSVNTVVLLEPGKAAVLGGLSRNSKVSERSGIPGLKEIPGVRFLFSRQVERTHQSQILVTIELERKPSGNPAAVASAEMLPLKEASSTEE